MPYQTARLHRMTVSTKYLSKDAFYPVAFFGISNLTQSNNINLLVFGYLFIDSNACLSLSNAPICLTTLSADRTPIHRTGLLRGINYKHSDGAMHFYGLDMVSPDWQLTQSIHTRSFINQSTLDIVTTILSDYDINWQISETLLSSERLFEPLAIRTQSDISDYEFITGLLADIGVFTLWISGDSVDNLGAWWLVNRLNESELLPLEYSYAQSSVQSGQDSIDTLKMNTRQTGSRTVKVRADGLAADTIYEGQALDESPLAIEDTTVLLAAHSRVNSDKTATQLAKQWVDANNCQRETYHASGAMRGIVVGSPISINNLPSIGRLSTRCIATMMIGIEPDNDSVSYHHQIFIEEWLEQTVQYAQRYHSNTIIDSIPKYAYDIARDTGVWASATLLDASISYCPYPSKQAFVSSSYQGLSQARTGDANSSTSPSYTSQITDDSLQQTVTTPVWSEFSPHDDGSTPPLRSLQLSSGATHGWQFSPRLGHPVLINHWYGDIDSPVISRSLYEGIGMGDTDEKDVTTCDAGLSNRHNLQGGSSPRWHGSGLGHSQISDDDTHSGWISGIAQYGLSAESEVTFSFDDTPNKVGLQWTVNTESHANVQNPTMTDIATFSPDEHVVELGVLRHRYSNHQSSDRGQGVNIATDHGLQVSGDTGVLLTTFGLRHSQSEHESAWVNDAGQQQLKIGAELGETLKEAKQAHLQSIQTLSNVNQSIDAFKTTAQMIDETLNAEVLGAPDVMLVSHDSIFASASNTLWTAKTIVRQSGATQSDTVAGNYTLTADSIESLSGVGGQADQSGLHISANREPLGIQAQGGELQLHSQQGMTIGSESGQVNVSSPKRIKLQTSAGASITIDNSGIKLLCPGTIKIKAVKKELLSGGKVNAPIISLLKSGLFSKAFDLKKLIPQDLIDQGISYKLINHTKGTEIEGKLDEDGQTLRVFGDKAEKVEFVLEQGVYFFEKNENTHNEEDVIGSFNAFDGEPVSSHYHDTDDDDFCC